MTRITSDTRFEAVSLSFNVGAPVWLAPGRQACGGDTDCGGVSNDCNGPSCDAGSNDPQLGLDARILVERGRLATLRAELQAIVARYTR